ncbi:DUF1963 domain-containing protein [Conexibacter sp. SYSU D00693]|uniref:DUF1963 domain-containing protein n=1 Tax=Conexibacter sp. SYSU D00693 TaxID=2812560 RepID=UPI00196A4834|nr:DUF1963 domain-containing protein [Conexibacter sp. SYSU D00693]
MSAAIRGACHLVASPVFAVVDIAWWGDDAAVVGALVGDGFLRVGDERTSSREDALTSIAYEAGWPEAGRGDWDAVRLDLGGARAVVLEAAQGDQETVGILAQDLAAVLASRDWSQIGEGFAVLVQAQDVYEDGDALRPSRVALGNDRLHAILRGDALHAASEPSLARDAARRLGTPVTNDHVAGSWALVLEAGGHGLSRLGGRPLLPTGTDWPAGEGRRLTHLATMVLDELPDIAGRELLPAAGTLAVGSPRSDGTRAPGPPTTQRPSP